jgi:hypothetical protein
MNDTHLAAANIELPTLLSELHHSSSASKLKSKGKAKEAPSSTENATQPKHEDIELMSLPAVIGREAGERDPLSLRSKIISDDQLDGIRQ